MKIGNLTLAASLLLASLCASVHAETKFVVLPDLNFCELALNHYRHADRGNSSLDARNLHHELLKMHELIQSLDAMASIRKSGLNRIVFESDAIDAAQLLVTKISEGMASLQQKMVEHLNRARKQAVESGPVASPEMRSVYLDFDLLLSALQKIKLKKVVIVNWPVVPSFDYQSSIKLILPAEIPLTRFDFTAGFAVEVFTSNYSGIVAHMNPLTGQIQQQSAYRRSGAITGIAQNGDAIIRWQGYQGLSSAFNPITGKWEVFEGYFRMGNAAVYDPISKTVREFKEHRSSAAVYNPDTQKIETFFNGSRFGSVGYFDPVKRAVQWIYVENAGVALIVRDEQGRFHSSNGFYGGDGDD